MRALRILIPLFVIAVLSTACLAATPATQPTIRQAIEAIKAATPKAYIPQAIEAKPGGQVKLQVLVDRGGVIGGDFEVHFDPKVLSNPKVSLGPAAKGSLWNPDAFFWMDDPPMFRNQWGIVQFSPRSGVLRWAMWTTTDSSEIGGGALAELTFDVAEDASMQETPVLLTTAMLNEVEAIKFDGSVVVIPKK